MKKKEYVFCGEYSGELYRSESLIDIYKVSKDIKETDRRYHIQDIYYYELEIINGDRNEQGQLLCYTNEVKIYKRGNKIYCKSI